MNRWSLRDAVWFQRTFNTEAMAADVATAAAEVAGLESAGAPALPADTTSEDAAPAVAPLREDQIVNAVSFLTNPKVCSG